MLNDNQKFHYQIFYCFPAHSSRLSWRTVCEASLSDFVNDWASTSMKHPAARHAATAKPKTGIRCPHCSRVCASEFGLRSHLRIHTAHRFNNSQQCNVVVDLNGLQQQQQQYETIHLG